MLRQYFPRYDLSLHIPEKKPEHVKTQLHEVAHWTVECLVNFLQVLSIGLVECHQAHQDVYKFSVAAFYKKTYDLRPN